MKYLHIILILVQVWFAKMLIDFLRYWPLATILNPEINPASTAIPFRGALLLVIIVGIGMIFYKRWAQYGLLAQAIFLMILYTRYMLDMDKTIYMSIASVVMIEPYIISRRAREGHKISNPKQAVQLTGLLILLAAFLIISVGFFAFGGLEGIAVWGVFVLLFLYFAVKQIKAFLGKSKNPSVIAPSDPNTHATPHQ